MITQDDAEQDAVAAAARASVVMGELDTVEGLRGAADLFARIWETPSVPPMPHDILRSLVHAGDGCMRPSAMVISWVRLSPCSPLPLIPRATR